MEEEGIYVCLTFAPNPLPDAVAEKTKEQASHLGGAVFSGAGNIAAATHQAPLSMGFPRQEYWSG